MLDEFPALGRLDFFKSALAFMAGYGLKSFLIAQLLNQIEKAYGPNNDLTVASLRLHLQWTRQPHRAKDFLQLLEKADFLHALVKFLMRGVFGRHIGNGDPAGFHRRSLLSRRSPRKQNCPGDG